MKLTNSRVRYEGGQLTDEQGNRLTLGRLRQMALDEVEGDE